METGYRVVLEDDRAFDIVVAQDGSLTLNGEEAGLDAVRTGPDSWHVLYGKKSHEIRLLSFDMDRKELVIQVDEEEFRVKVNDRLDDLLSQMGMNISAGAVMEDVRAPMPGLVLSVLVSEGQTVKDGDPLLILEAMKMENIIKATGDGTIGKILVGNQDAVEKNQVLIEMD